MQINELFNLYLQDLSRREVKTIQQIVRLYERNLKKDLGAKKVNKVVRGEIAETHFKISDRSKTTANKCLGLLKAMFNLAITLSLIENNPATHIAKNREQKRKRYLTNTELLQVADKLKVLGQDKKLKQSCDFIWLLILTGCRKGELAKAKWTDLHDTMLILTEHKTDKFGEDRIIYLTPRALKIINNLNQDSEYLFTIKNPRRLWERIRSDLKLENLTLHDLRHSYASWGLQTLNLSQVGNLLGHKNQATTERYAHIHQDKAVKAAHQVGEHLESLLEPKDFLYQN